MKMIWILWVYQAMPKMLIIPSFSFNGTENKAYVDSIFRQYTHIKTQMDAFLARGGVIYTEGNAVYFIENWGICQPVQSIIIISIPADPSPPCPC